MKALVEHLKDNWQIVVIILIATWLRVWQLDTHAIFFPDAARDVIVAAEAVHQKTLPLLGIPSSIPRFKQGPIAIWIEMATILVAGENLLAISLVFALIGVAAIIAAYELATVHVSRITGIMVAGIMATSPLAVAHARMPYHTNPIPVATVLYVWALMRLHQQKRHSLFWATLAWSFAFQFELALLPLILLIPYLVWRSKQKLTLGDIVQAGLGLVVGLWPQIVFDLTHRFEQLGAFGVWVVYRLGSSFIPGTDHTFGGDNISQTLSTFWLYGGRIVSVDVVVFKVAWLLVLLIAAWISFKQLKSRRLPMLIEVTWIGFLMLMAGFFIHSSPSEAYFPVFIPLGAIVLGYGILQLPNTPKLVAMALVGSLCLANMIGMYQHSFFVSNQQAFSYSAGTGEQRLIVSQILSQTKENFRLSTTQPGKIFPSYFDNYRWWLRQAQVSENLDGTVVYIEAKDSPLNMYPGITKQVFNSVDLYYYE